MTFLQIIRSQYLATLEMLKQAIEKCPDAMWNDSADKNRFWHVAYHALFYTHLFHASLVTRQCDGSTAPAAGV